MLLANAEPVYSQVLQYAESMHCAVRVTGL